MKRLAVVLFNLGGPDSLQAVEPFLYNLFMDKAIIGAPLPIRWMIAKLISKRRAPLAEDIYRHLGGKSPLLELTQDQANALQASLCEKFPGVEVGTFIAMRYWHPLSLQTAQAVKEFAPDRVVLLPLYPQFSTTTTDSSFEDWAKSAAFVDLNVPHQQICCYPSEPGWIAAQAELLHKAMDEAKALDTGKGVRVLFSAHGLPKKIVEQKGDPYPDHVKQGAEAIAAAMQAKGQGLSDWLVSYQSRVGPLEWIGPSTDDEIKRAGKDGIVLVVLPIAFVSEHSETLVALDIEYKQLAVEAGVGGYVRVPAVGTHPAFIDGLGRMVKLCLDQDQAICPAGQSEHLCPTDAAGCGFRLSP